MKHYDILIVGAGVVGLALANLLPDDLTVGLVERSKLPVSGHDESVEVGRVSSLNLSSLALLNCCGLASLQEQPAFKSIQVNDQESNAYVEFSATDLNESSLGCIVENNYLREQLVQQVRQKQSIDVFEASNITQILADKVVRIKTDEVEASCSYQLLVICDGASSKTRDLLGLSQFAYDYQQRAICTVVEHEYAHQQIAYQTFMKQGVLAYLPLQDAKKSAVVWSLNQQESESVVDMQTSEFCDVLTQSSTHILSKLGWVKNSAARQVFPLVMRQAKRYVDHGVVLVGDSAHSIHPLAGQGLNLGLQDVEALIAVVKKARAERRDFSLDYSLKPYQRQRKMAVWKMIATTSALNHVFQRQGLWATLLRSMGMRKVNQHAWLKSYFMRQVQ